MVRVRRGRKWINGMEKTPSGTSQQWVRVVKKKFDTFKRPDSVVRESSKNYVVSICSDHPPSHSQKGEILCSRRVKPYDANSGPKTSDVTHALNALSMISSSCIRTKVLRFNYFQTDWFDMSSTYGLRSRWFLVLRVLSSVRVLEHFEII